MNIPGTGRINKKLSNYLGNQQKSGFEKYIHSQSFNNYVEKKNTTAKKVDIELVTFTESKSFPDLILSILSFISMAGLPVKWTIYADDEFTTAQQNIFSQFNFLVCKNWFINISEQERKKYSDKWQFRKFKSFSTHPLNGTTIFLDSDVVFYQQFNKYKEHVKEANWYLPEPTDAYSIDPRITERKDYRLGMYIINSGFMVLNETPPWEFGMAYLDECWTDDSVTHFSEQSAINIVFANDLNGKVLEPRIFHVSTVDHFKLSFVNTAHIAIRHYVGPIRYKMWQSGWKQFI